MKICINGSWHDFSRFGSCDLLTFLRDRLHLTGTKKGCGTGDCGACTVLVDGVPTLACVTPMSRLEGKNVITIEGIGSKNRLDPLQIAFLRTGAVQCGYCTPGIILRAKSLLEKKELVRDEDIKRALAPNICRCTGYQSIVDAVLLAQEAYRGKVDLELITDKDLQIGSGVISWDAVEKVNGSAKYAADLYLKNMLLVGVFRSPYKHAEVLKIDTSKAERIEGVEVIVTAKDVPGINRTGTTSLKDQPILAEEKVRYLGEPIVAIAARDAGVLSKALSKIKVTFKELNAVRSPSEALTKGAPKIHELGNILYSRVLIRGNVEKGIDASDAVVEQEFSTGFVEHAYLEPEAGVAYQKNGTIFIHTGGQDAHFYQGEIARVLGLDHEELQKVRVINTPTGGGFGGKIDVSVQGILALLATRTKKPLKFVYTREESFLATPKRHPFVMSVKLAAGKDGKLKALRASLLADTGAYASWGRAVLTRACVHATGPYEIPNVYVDGRIVYTNNPVCGAFRGFGVPQVTFAIESAIDMLAAKIGMDPLKLRKINCLRKKSTTATGQRLENSVGIGKCLSAVTKYHRREKARIEKGLADAKPERYRVGVGVASMWFGIGYTGMPNSADATIELLKSGKFRIYTGACDIGQGSNTVLWQIAAKALGVPLEYIELVSADTGLTTNTNITCASRQTSFSGNAVMSSAIAMRDMIIKMTSEVLDEPYPENIVWDNGRYLSQKRPQKGLSINQIWRHLRAKNLPTKLTSVFSPDIEKLNDTSQGKPYSSYAFGAQVAVVEVDTETRSIKVKRVIAAHDVGKAINRVKVEGQIAGGVVMGIGYALTEEYIPVETRNYKTYKVPRITKKPEMRIIIVEDFDPLGPFGAKGVGEPAMVPTAPAIANAIFDATGLRATRLPIRVSQKNGRK